jgi:hypothetical protein
VIYAVFAVVTFGFVVHKVRRHGRQVKQSRQPLAGFDTGTRSPWRAPRGVRWHKGF